jgi:hypothetical protein
MLSNGSAEVEQRLENTDCVLWRGTNKYVHVVRATTVSVKRHRPTSDEDELGFSINQRDQQVAKIEVQPKLSHGRS